MTVLRTAGTAQGSTWERAGPAAAVAVYSTALLLALLWPAFYWRNRRWLLPATRIIAFLPPSNRSVGAGTGVLLSLPPRPGAVGAVLDWMRVLLGTRVLAATLTTLVFPLPPATTLVTQAALVALSANRKGYCGALLLREPLTQRRVSGLAAGLDYLVAPLLALQPAVGGQGPAVRAGGAPAQSVCSAVVSFTSLLLVVLLPTLLSTCLWRPPEAAAAAEEPGEAAGGGGDGSVRLRRAGKLAGIAGQASARANNLLHSSWQEFPGVLERGLMCWSVASFCWLGCKLSMGFV